MADEEAVKALRAILEQTRQHLDYVIMQLRATEEDRYPRWRCRRCEFVKVFTRPMPASPSLARSGRAEGSRRYDAAVIDQREAP